MKRILHLSDLHYGRDDPALEAPLLAAIDRLTPDLVVVSGDFTQRARVSQFEQARAFLDRITAPVLAVPGNHDTPLDNLYLRFFRPFGRYRAHIDRELEPVYEDKDLSVVGINTVNRFAWQRGRVSGRTLNRVSRAFEVAEGKLQIAVLHHPLEQAPGVDKSPTQGAGRALRQLAACGADVVLSGHLHTAATAPFSAAPGLLFVQAGTGLSTRRRGEENTFNLLEIEAAGALRVTTWGAETGGADTASADVGGDGATGFRPGPSALYRRDFGGWRLEAEGRGSDIPSPERAPGLSAEARYALRD